LSRGDLSEAEWRTEGVGGRSRRTVQLSTGYFGGFAAARHGAMCCANMAVGTRFTGGFGARARPGSGRPYRSRWPRSWRTPAIISSTAPPFAPTSWQRTEPKVSAAKRGAHRRALGRSRGWFASNLHCLADARGRPLAFHLTVGEAADCKAYDTLITLPEQAPNALLRPPDNQPRHRHSI
jgi:hypothetical protein